MRQSCSRLQDVDKMVGKRGCVMMVCGAQVLCQAWYQITIRQGCSRVCCPGDVVGKRGDERVVLAEVDVDVTGGLVQVLVTMRGRSCVCGRVLVGGVAVRGGG